MDLSIIIVNFNTREMTLECLRSVYAGLGRLRAEVIVVDNASSDGSADAIAGAFPRVKLIRSERNLGFAGGNNLAFPLALGRHVLLLNSDTLILGDVLTASVAYMDARPEVGAMGCRVLNTDGTMQPTCSRFPTLLNLLLLTTGAEKLGRPAFLDRYRMTRWDRRSERDVEVISGCYLLVRRDALLDVGPLDDGFFFYGEETDWCRRCAACGWALKFAPVGEIVHHGSASARKLSHRRDLLLTQGLVRLHRKHGGVLPAAAAWAILYVFNLSRARYWKARSRWGVTTKASERRAHFEAVVSDFSSVWAGSTARRVS
jgi:GT2 family glycosyltransferase